MTKITIDRAVVEQLEWSEIRTEYSGTHYVCPVCDEYRHNGHKEDCALRTALANAEQQGCQYPDCKCPTENPCLKGLPNTNKTLDKLKSSLYLCFIIHLKPTNNESTTHTIRKRME